MYKSLNTHKISERTGKSTVAIVGFSKDTRHLAPYDDEDTEIWSLNEAGRKPWMKRWDRWFQIHPRDSFARKDNPYDPDHLEWLKSQTKPIYMHEHYDFIPSSVKYPLTEIIAKYGSYLSSTAAYMLTLAMLEGYERIEIFGMRMGSMTEYHYQRSNFEYLIGLARGLGHEVYLPPECPLCKGKLYGYESMEVAYRQQLEYKMTDVQNEHKIAELNAVNLSGRINELDTIRQMYPNEQPLAERFGKLAEEVRKAQANANFLQGTIDGLSKAIDLYDTHLEQTGVGNEQESAEESHRDS